MDAAPILAKIESSVFAGILGFSTAVIAREVIVAGQKIVYRTQLDQNHSWQNTATKILGRTLMIFGLILGAASVAMSGLGIGFGFAAIGLEKAGIIGGLVGCAWGCCAAVGASLIAFESVGL